MTTLPSAQEYEQFIYTLPDRYPAIRTSTLVMVRESAMTARIEGQVLFDKDIVLDVWERLNFRQSVIQSYSYRRLPTSPLRKPRLYGPPVCFC